MHKLRYIVVVSNAPLPIHFSSISQAIRVAERISSAAWTIRITKACSPNVCGTGKDCAGEQHEPLEPCSTEILV
jgi:hypothetical protein